MLIVLSVKIADRIFGIVSILLTGLTYKAVSKILIEFALLYPRKIGE
ncbi:hypothetical protein KF282_2532 [Lactococcus lactis subsp. lactis]|uniref:Uncharacterized protein n=1 Tax=Lactococcus lactis subsp. lactis TaxID=1360 RepID=A0A0V8CJU5_LACLL|nr:hypothetical protein KF282_2532 [Lactococcus lactis subsp. lactis]